MLTGMRKVFFEYRDGYLQDTRDKVEQIRSAFAERCNDLDSRIKAIEDKADDFGFNVRQYVEKRMAEGDIELSDKQVKRCISERQIKEAAEEVLQDIDFSDDIQSALESLAGNGQLDDCFENSKFIQALYENEEFMRRLAYAMLDAVAEKRIRK